MTYCGCMQASPLKCSPELLRELSHRSLGKYEINASFACGYNMQDTTIDSSGTQSSVSFTEQVRNVRSVNGDSLEVPREWRPLMDARLALRNDAGAQPATFVWPGMPSMQCWGGPRHDTTTLLPAQRAQVALQRGVVLREGFGG